LRKKGEEERKGRLLRGLGRLGLDLVRGGKERRRCCLRLSLCLRFCLLLLLLLLLLLFLFFLDCFFLLLFPRPV
jgi:hypothetical protein